MNMFSTVIQDFTLLIKPYYENNNELSSYSFIKKCANVLLLKVALCRLYL
jgi:hypothetical protein